MIFGTHQENTLEQYHDVASRAVKSALMADGHFGYVMPIGGVCAYRNEISVVGVGVDIACGNAALNLGMVPPRNSRQHAKLADEIYNTFAFGKGKVNRCDDAPSDHPLFEDPRWSLIPRKFRDSLRDTARNQLGTIGGGNHYIDILVDPKTSLGWVGVHFGSRALGFKISNAFLSLQQGGAWDERGPEEEVLLSLDSPLGSDYFHLMELAGEYAYAGREWVVNKVASMISTARPTDYIHNHHNFAWKEEHWVDCAEGAGVDAVKEELIVIRKGATPAFPDQKGFVGGSMGDNAVILKGRRNTKLTSEYAEGAALQEAALFSTVHGAGRVMGRMDAKGKRGRDGEWKRAPRVIQSEVDGWLEAAGVTLRGGGVDEAPQVYRRLPDVLQAQGPTVTVLHTLKPLIVCMADD